MPAGEGKCPHMPVTLQQIADAAGVSRGTVDRALKNKGRIKPETAEKIKQLAKEMGYKPSRAGRALALAKRNIKIGVIVQSAKTEFMQNLLKGAESAKREVESLEGTVDIFCIDGVDAAREIEIMNQLKEQNYSGIAIVPANAEILMHTINQFSEEYEIPIVTFNSDVPGSRRLCYVGQDVYRGGQMACGLMGELLSGIGQVAIISSYQSTPAMVQRTSGFIEEAREHYPGISVVGVRYCYEDNWVSEKIMDELLEQYPNLAGVYVSGSGLDGVSRSLVKNGRAKDIRLVGNDIVEGNIRWVKKGVVDFLIGQNAYVQGYDPVMILFRLFIDGKKPSKELQYTDIVIKNKYNV